MKGSEIHHVDVSTAYVNSPLEETIFVEQPEEFVEDSKQSVATKENFARIEAEHDRMVHNAWPNTVLHENGL